MTLQRIALMGAGSVQAAGYTITDADALAWANNVASSDGGVELEDAIKQAVDAYVQSLKSNNVWTSAAQLLLPCGPRTLAGALRPLKGAAPTNAGGNFTSSHYNRKDGLGKPSNTNAYLNSNVAVNSVGATSHALFAYGSMTASSGDPIVIGRFDGTNGTSLISLDEWSAYLPGRAFRSGTTFPAQIPFTTSTAAVACMIGSRTSATSSALYVDGSSVTNAANVTPVLSSQNFYIYSLNTNNSAAPACSAILQATGIFSAGLNATQAAALRTATATYVAAVAAAIP